MRESCEESAPRGAAGSEGARKRAAVETFSRHRASLMRTARRFSLCEDDAEEALQRGLEILLRKAPSTDPRELIRWTQTVVKHEALAVRRDRERILAGPAAVEDPGPDWTAQIPAETAGPAELAERQEDVARSREALRSLKPQELRALGLLAEGYSYREIGELTGFSQTKVNRCLAEGRERFRRAVASGEDGSRCAELRPRLSALCDGEAGPEEAERLREHLRACGGCRATLRAYRAAPAAAAALAPTLPLGRPLLERAQEALASVATRFGGGDAALSPIAAGGGTRGTGMVALAKVLALCAGTVGGAAACAATGVIPAPLAAVEREAKPNLVREAVEPEPEVAAVEDPDHQPVETASEPEPAPAPEPKPEPEPEPPPAPPAPPPSSAGAVEFAPAPAPPPVPPPASSSGAGSGSAAGEFGP